MRIYKLDSDIKDTIVSSLSNRANMSDGEFAETVDSILSDIRQNRDDALFKYINKFDSPSITKSNIEVTKEEIDNAYKNVSPRLVKIINKAANNITDFHIKQKREGWITTKQGIMLGQRIIPMERAGVYVPGGKAVYPSSVLMNIIPAKVAGVEEIIMVTPPEPDGSAADSTLVAAHIAGVDRIFKCGGAQAIGALAYGTQTIPKVDKIVGPGNIYVALAKRAVFGHVGIDSVAGPSEILIIADESANPRFVAADLLSQAEHDEMASAILLTTSMEVANAVDKEVEAMIENSSRKDIIRASIDTYGYIIVCDSKKDVIDMANTIASEHLEIITKNPYDDMTHIKHAGAIFLGEYSSEPLGDYFAGPNHVLPTCGSARFFSALSVDDFIKKSSIISYSKEALYDVADDIIEFANNESLQAHANSIKVRLES